MATYTFDKIEYGGNTYVVSDSGALQLTGGQVTGPVTFGDSVSIDEATLGDLVVNGSASFTNNIQANTINGVTVGNSPKFSDTVTTVTTSGSGNAITAISASNGALTATKGSTFLTGITSSQVTTALGYTPYNSTNPNGYTTNTGTVTKVTAGTGLSIGSTAGGNFTTTGTINHTNSVTAQTTQAIYPIKIDAQGHISAYGSAVTPLTSHQTIKQDGVTGATGNHFGTCSIAAGTAAKTVSITAGTPTLEAGLRVTVKFANANTAGTPTLNVNSLGAKNIFHNGAQITTGANKALLAGTVEFVYDGTQWQLVGNYVDTDTKAWSSITGKPTATGSNTTGITGSTTATKTTLGTAFTIPNVTAAGSASTWVFEDIACDDITSWSAGSGSASISGAVDGSDSTQLNITISHTHTAPSLGYTARTVSSKKSGANGTAPTLGTAFTVPNVTSNTSATVSITDNGHTHSIS